MAPRRLTACCLGVAAAGLLMLGCGSGGDSTSADIDPDTAADFTNKLAVINAYAADGQCDRATQALGTLMQAVDLESGQTGEQFTTDLQDLLGRLDGQLQEQCQQAEETTSTTTEATDTESTVTDDTDPSTISTTTTTTTKPTTTTTSTTSTPTPPTSPPNGNGNGNGPTTPGGGISPGGKKEAADAHIKKPKPESKGDRNKGGKREKREKHKEQSR